jgi:hypothetical protein
MTPAAPRAAQNAYARRWRALRKANGTTGGGRVAEVPCEVCNAPDARAADHRTGCPTMAPLSRAELLAIALNCERGWAEMRENARSAGA